MKFLLLLSAVALATCSPVSEESVMKMVVGNFVNCMNSDLSLCLKEHALKVTERLRTVRQLKIIDGVTILNNGPKESRSLEFSSEPELRKKQVSEQLWESTSDLLQNSDLELSWAGPEDEEESRALDDVEEGRGKKKQVKKKLKMLLPLLILAKIKAAAIVVVSLLIIAVSIFKLALMAKVAFIIKAIAILKSLLHKKFHDDDQGWVSHEPHHEHYSHGGGGGGWDGGWSRSQANNLAYSAYTQ